MNLHITGHHVQVTPAIRDYVSGKMERVTKHFDHVIDVNVIMSVAKLRQKVEATVHVRGKESQQRPAAAAGCRRRSVPARRGLRLDPDRHSSSYDPDGRLLLCRALR